MLWSLVDWHRVLLHSRGWKFGLLPWLHHDRIIYLPVGRVERTLMHECRQKMLLKDRHQSFFLWKTVRQNSTFKVFATAWESVHPMLLSEQYFCIAWEFTINGDHRTIQTWEWWIKVKDYLCKIGQESGFLDSKFNLICNLMHSHNLTGEKSVGSQKYN